MSEADEQKRPDTDDTSVDVTSKVVEFIESRQAIGIERYGQTLMTFDGRDHLLDLQQELGDALQYVVAFRMEYAEFREAIHDLMEMDGVILCGNPKCLMTDHDAACPVGRILRIGERIAIPLQENNNRAAQVWLDEESSKGDA